MPPRPAVYRSPVGMKRYEPSNNPGNVMTVISDKITPIDTTSDGLWDYFNPSLVSATDYYPFGMGMPGRSYISTYYRYGMQGSEIDDEISEYGNIYNMEAREYDSRTHYPWSTDPKTHQYPSQSPYGMFNGNPILYNDPTGKSGELTIDKQSKTITIDAKIVLYGSGANKFLAKTTARDIQKLYNSANGKVIIDGVTYQVKASITGEYREDNASLKNEISENSDFKNNYYRVESTTGNVENTSFNDDYGNTGIFKREEITENNSTTEVHEFTHGLGLVHNSYFQNNIQGQPDIMDTRGDLAKYPYALPDGTLDISKRKVTQSNIDAIFTERVKEELNKYGKGGIGKLTNQYHEKPK